MEYSVSIQWDEEADVWTAASGAIPGLVLESGSIDALIEGVKHAAPELLALNRKAPATAIDFKFERREPVFA